MHLRFQMNIPRTPRASNIANKRICSRSTIFKNCIDK